MLCKHCKTETVAWKGLLSALTHTECTSCGGINCHVTAPRDEDDHCPFCDSPVEFEEPENCSCHINPPCSACLSRRLHCTECGEIFE